MPNIGILLLKIWLGICGNLLLVTIDNAGGQQQIMEKIINEVKIHDISGTTSGS